MSGAITAAVVVGGAAAYSAKQQRKAAKEAAKGSEATPWGPTGPYMEEILGGAMDRFRGGEFQFGTDPNLYNAYLGYGRDNLGLSIPEGANMDLESTGYGPGAYEYMLNLMQGPAWQGAQRTNPGAMIGAPNPLTAGLMGGLGAYTAFQGMGGGAAAPEAIPVITQGQGSQGSTYYPPQRIDPTSVIYGGR